MEDIRAIYRIFNNLKYEISCLIQSFFILLKWHGTFLRRGRQFFSQLYHLFFKKSAQRKEILE